VRVVPTINTPRLRLRAMRPEDFPRFAEIWANPEVVRYIGGEPWSEHQAWTSFLRNVGQWQLTGFGQWAIEHRDTQTMIGQVGFFSGGRGFGVEFDSFPEAGWVLDSDYHGSGLGGEAAAAAHEWFDRVVTGPLVAVLDLDNLASRAIATNLGYRLLEERSYKGSLVELVRRKGMALS